MCLFQVEFGEKRLGGPRADYSRDVSDGAGLVLGGGEVTLPGREQAPVAPGTTGGFGTSERHGNNGVPSNRSFGFNMKPVHMTWASPYQYRPPNTLMN